MLLPMPLTRKINPLPPIIKVSAQEKRVRDEIVTSPHGYHGDGDVLLMVFLWQGLTESSKSFNIIPADFFALFLWVSCGDGKALVWQRNKM